MHRRARGACVEDAGPRPCTSRCDGERRVRSPPPGRHPSHAQEGEQSRLSPSPAGSCFRVPNCEPGAGIDGARRSGPPIQQRSYRIGGLGRLETRGAPLRDRPSPVRNQNVAAERAPSDGARVSPARSSRLEFGCQVRLARNVYRSRNSSSVFASARKRRRSLSCGPT